MEENKKILFAILRIEDYLGTKRTTVDSIFDTKDEASKYLRTNAKEYLEEESYFSFGDTHSKEMRLLDDALRLKGKTSHHGTYTISFEIVPVAYKESVMFINNENDEK